MFLIYIYIYYICMDDVLTVSYRLRTHTLLLFLILFIHLLTFFFFWTQNTPYWVKSSPPLQDMEYYFRISSIYWFFRGDYLGGDVVKFCFSVSRGAE